MNNKAPNHTNNTIRFAFFGTPDRAVIALNCLKEKGFVPALIITQPDKPQGRKLVITPPPAKLWAQEHHVPVLQPEKMNDPAFVNELKKEHFDLFIVVAYGKIIPQSILDIPRKGALNIHASLLPKLRGASPIETAILNDDHHTGVSIILMDNEMDHGPIVALKEVLLTEWPIPADELAHALVKEAAYLLADTLNPFLKGEVKLLPQNHEQATYTTKIKKEDGLIDFSNDPYKNFLKYNAYKTWPGTFFFAEENGKKIRMKITKARFENGQFIIEKVIPEGKKEMNYRMSN